MNNFCVTKDRHDCDKIAKYNKKDLRPKGIDDK